MHDITVVSIFSCKSYAALWSVLGETSFRKKSLGAGGGN